MTLLRGRIIAVVTLELIFLNSSEIRVRPTPSALHCTAESAGTCTPLNPTTFCPVSMFTTMFFFFNLLTTLYTSGGLERIPPVKSESILATSGNLPPCTSLFKAVLKCSSDKK